MKTSFLFSTLMVALALGTSTPPASALAPTRIYDLDGCAGTMDSMIVGADGHFYGTTNGRAGAIEIDPVTGDPVLDMYGNPIRRVYAGEIFQYKLDGTYTTLYLFPTDGSQGKGPTRRLVQTADGNFYGTAQQGGAHGCGTIFQLTPAGVLTVLHHFSNTDGRNPWTLTLGSDGDLYGTTISGTNYWGTIFKITTAGVFTSLVNVPTTFGSFPLGLTQGPDGNFYGITYNASQDRGRFYSVDSSGLLTNLAEVNGSDQAYGGGLTLGSDGNFYGTTMACPGYAGMVFKATTTGVVTRLTYLFPPCGGLREGADGSLYGTSPYSYAPDPVTGRSVTHDGGVFSVTKAGVLTQVATFDSLANSSDYRAEGARPYGGVTFGEDGNLYGTTICGGANNGGVIFRLNMDDVAAVQAAALLAGKTTAVTPPGGGASFGISGQPASCTGDTGKPVTFTVAVTGDGTKAYQWRKNGRPLTASAQFSGVKTGSLKIANVRKVDAGAYSVLVVSKTGKVVSRALSAGAVLTVNVVDTDGDGVSDDADRYAGTVAGDAVNKMGGSIAQLVPAAGPVNGGVWKNHGTYVGAVARTATAFRKAKLITAAQASEIVRAAAASNVGNAVVGL